MKQVDITSVLNQIVVMHGRSLPVYMTDAMPWMNESEGSARAVIQSIAGDQIVTVNRLADHIQSIGGTVSSGAFPTYYADWNDLSLEFLITKAAQEQAANIADLEILIPTLVSDPKAKALGEEALGAAKAHLDTLTDILGVAS